MCQRTYSLSLTRGDHDGRGGRGSAGSRLDVLVLSSSRLSRYSTPIPIRRHHHLSHQAVLDTELGVYLYWRTLGCCWSTSCFFATASPFDALHVDLRLQGCWQQGSWRRCGVCCPRFRFVVAFLAPPSIASLAPTAAKAVFAASYEVWEVVMGDVRSLGCSDCRRVGWRRSEHR